MTNEQAVACTVLAMRRRGIHETQVQAVLDELLDEIYASHEVATLLSNQASMMDTLHVVDERMQRVEEFLKMQFSYY